MVKKNVSYWKAQIMSFVSSFKSLGYKRFWSAAFFDFMAFISIVIVLNLFFILINYTSADLLVGLSQINSLQVAGDSQGMSQKIIELTPLMNRVLWHFLIALLVAFLLVMFLLSWFYGKSWSVFLQKKPGPKHLINLFLLNTVWFIFFTVLLALTMAAFKPMVAAVVSLIILVLIFYLDPVMRALFDDKKTVWNNINSTFRVGKFIHWFIPFIILALILFIILMLILSLILRIHEVLFFVMSIIIMILFVGWLRSYASMLTKEVQARYKIK
ncbi:hypothetical protein JW756_00715 [Candidatus Woesearchaeota archaeon]|nr:hypothetical protein [Candidatus Woesearchaeota archaeon]